MLQLIGFSGPLLQLAVMLFLLAYAIPLGIAMTGMLFVKEGFFSLFTRGLSAVDRAKRFYSFTFGGVGFIAAGAAIAWAMWNYKEVIAWTKNVF